MSRYLWLLALFFVPWTSASDPPLGRIGDQSYYLQDLSPKEQLQLYRHAEKLERLARQYAERYAFDTLVRHQAEQATLDPNEYLRIKLYRDMPAITDMDVQDYIDAHPHLRQSSTLSPERLQQRVRRSLLEERRDERMEELKQELFSAAGVQLSTSSFGIPAPNLQVPVTEEDYKLGSQDAKLNLVVFLDFECPYCRRLFPILLELKERFGDDLRLVFKHLPLPIHKGAFRWAVATECAGRQGEFVDFVRTAYAHSKPEVAAVAKQVGLDLTAFDQCLAEDTDAADKVKKDMAFAEEAGITATPTLVFGEFPVIGMKQQAELERLIQARLGSAIEPAP